MARETRAVVIGSGVESLVAASLLARAGCATIVLEKREEPGGTRAPWPDGRAFGVPLVLDGAPRVHARLVRDLNLVKHGAALRAAPPSLSVIDDEGEVLEVQADVERTAAALAARGGPDGEAYRRFNGTLDRIARAAAPLLHRAPPGRSPADLWTGVLTGRRYLGLSRREAFTLLRWPPMPVADLVEEWFAHEPLRALVATRGLFGVFAGPRSAGTTAVLLLRAAAEGGLVPRGPVVEGGARTLVDALVSCAGAAGVTTRTRAEVNEILVERDRVAGVRLHDGSRVEADVIISGIGPRRTLIDLLAPMTLAPSIARRAAQVRARGAIARALVIVGDATRLTTRRGVPLPDDSIVHLTPSVDHLERAFDAMKYGGWAARPWLELTTHTPLAESKQSSGQRAVAVTVHGVPGTLRQGDWAAAARSALSATILETLEHYLPGIGARATAFHVLTPLDLAADLGLAGGHPLHAELTLDQLWMARPALGLGGYRTPVTGLYLCGPGTHPGVGPAGTSGLLSGRAAVRDIRHAR